MNEVDLTQMCTDRDTALDKLGEFSSRLELCDESVGEDMKALADIMRSARDGHTVYFKETGEETKAFCFLGWANAAEVIKELNSFGHMPKIVTLAPFGPVLIRDEEHFDVHLYDFVVEEDGRLLMYHPDEFLDKYVFSKVELLVTSNPSL